MQAIITREEWEDYQRLKRESVAEGKVIDLRVAEEMEKLAQAFKSAAGQNSFFSGKDVCQAIKNSARIVREKLSK